MAECRDAEEDEERSVRAFLRVFLGVSASRRSIRTIRFSNRKIVDRIPFMLTPKDTLESFRLEMRWRTLSLAADLDRIERAGGADLLKTDPSMQKLRQALKVLLDGATNRAEQVQMIFSDTTPGPL